MSDLVKDLKPELTHTSFAQHMHKAKTPLQREHLETVVRHSKGEVEADLDLVLPTLVAEPNYHEYGVLANRTDDTGPKGYDAVLANYTEMVNNGSYVIESKKTRVVVSDSEVVTEGTYRQILTAAVARKMGYVDDSSPQASHYVLAGRTIVFWEFNDEGLAMGEDRYVMNHEVLPISDADLPADYPAQFRAS
jgi:hypothetical protein